MNSQHGLPLYRSHKIVAAALIVAFSGTSSGNGGYSGSVVTVQLPNGAGCKTIAVPDNFAARGAPEPNHSYLVEYADGYLSHSPKDVFEAGNQPLDRLPAVAGQLLHFYSRGKPELGNHVTGISRLALRTIEVDAERGSDRFVTELGAMAVMPLAGDHLYLALDAAPWLYQVTEVAYLRSTNTPNRLFLRRLPAEETESALAKLYKECGVMTL